ncbi:hypothetical protein HMPREF1863_01113 [Aedoeadaptatus coxii]|uniref:Uncharacterized protein n=1 Tax=Aedoeadaptatus coxii TaxID=755172 RepID=A0A134AEY5_9FIRM|nr:hypothetical protein HMPREF1863_01113 [Peptoniphilus coxii]
MMMGLQQSIFYMLDFVGVTIGHDFYDGFLHGVIDLYFYLHRLPPYGFIVPTSEKMSIPLG